MIFMLDRLQAETFKKKFYYYEGNGRSRVRLISEEFVGEVESFMLIWALSSLEDFKRFESYIENSMQLNSMVVTIFFII